MAPGWDARKPRMTGFMSQASPEPEIDGLLRRALVEGDLEQDPPKTVRPARGKKIEDPNDPPQILAPCPRPLASVLNLRPNRAESASGAFRPPQVIHRAGDSDDVQKVTADSSQPRHRGYASH